MFDVVIVGAGTAGCVLAERLTRSGKLRVLLLEAGGEPKNRFVSIPAGFTRLFETELDWADESTPQMGPAQRRIFTPRGRMLGGSSNLNAQIHQWCHPQDYADWEALGAEGWAWSDVAPIFRAQESWSGDDRDPARGREGPMRIAPNRNVRSLSRAFVDSARASGFGSAPTYNGAAYRGAWLAELAHHRGKRFSAYHAFLAPARRRRNLEVVPNATVARLRFEGRRVTGVVAQRGDVRIDYTARQIVLAAGALGTPPVLMRSGIGEPAALQALAIPLAVDAPEVGANLQDHPVVATVFRASTTDTLRAAESLPQLLRYLLLGRGMLASNGVEGFAFTNPIDRPEAAPTLELMMLPFEYRDQLLEPPQEHAFSIASAVVAPRSRGALTLASPDPSVPATIDFGLFSDAEGHDAAVMLAGLKLARRIAASDPLARWNAGELRPGAAVQSDAELLEYVASAVQTVYHPSGTCRMGSDARSVADPRLRVRGVEGLWVADASVMPTVPRGHPNAVVAMIAHRAAEWIEAAACGLASARA